MTTYLTFQEINEGFTPLGPVEATTAEAARKLGAAKVFAAHGDENAVAIAACPASVFQVETYQQELEPRIKRTPKVKA